MSEKPEGAGRRRPKPDEIPPLFVRLIEGASWNQACAERGIDAPSALHMVNADDRLRQHYALARAVAGDRYGTQVAVIALQVLSGKIKPEAGRVAMDGLKWTAARMAPKGWGDKVAHEVFGADGGPIRFDFAKLTDEQLEQLGSLLGLMGGAGGSTEPTTTH